MLARLQTYASFVRFSHSVFALPFALVGAVLATRTAGFHWERLIWITACMVSAAARRWGSTGSSMRDLMLGTRGPHRESSPTGRMTSREASLFVAVASVVFIACSIPLGGLCFALSPVALAIVFCYS